MSLSISFFSVIDIKMIVKDSVDEAGTRTGTWTIVSNILGIGIGNW
ncbi:MAG: hypothetical protein HC787_06750 [Nostocaceae cyanobacterium CSU_2_110]|nr:hypothetical protein [Nostocaceae cyanobacterium CSU_2_110]